MIDGKRKRVITPNPDKENSNRKMTGDNKRVPRSDDKRDKGREKSESSKKRNKLLTPSATSTPTPKRRNVITHIGMYVRSVDRLIS